MASFPAGSYVVPRDAHGVRMQLAKAWLSVGVDLALLVIGSLPVIRIAAAVAGAYFVIIALWESSHRRDGPEMAFARDGIHHVRLGRIGWDRVRHVRRRPRTIIILIGDAAGLARGKGPDLPLLDRIYYGVLRRPLVIAANTVRPASLDQVAAELQQWSGGPGA